MPPETSSRQAEALTWRCGERSLTVGPPTRVMGILNVTPDSFSDGGRFSGLEEALAHGRRMLEEGADMVDIGGESTRPGAARVPEDEEIRRVVPVVRELARLPGACLSVDTTKAAVARAALEAGARIVNDVSAMTHDPDMARVVRDSGAGVVLMHMRGTPRTMQCEPRYNDVVDEVRRYLGERMEDAVSAGIEPACICLDPGIGFGKTVAHNLALLRGLPQLASLGRPLLLGASRKSFLGTLLDRTVGQRQAGHLAVTVYGALHGAGILRVHDVRDACDAATLVDILGHGGC